VVLTLSLLALTSSNHFKLFILHLLGFDFKWFVPLKTFAVVDELGPLLELF
jgi:hypothetical protein